MLAMIMVMLADRRHAASDAISIFLSSCRSSCIMAHVQLDPVWFGVLLTMNLAIRTVHAARWRST